MNIGCGMLNPVAWNSLNNSSATLASASAEGFRGPILFITLEAYLAVECNTQDCLNINKSYIQQSFMIENDVCVRGEKKTYLLGGTQARPGLLLSQKAQLRESELLKEKP